MRSNAKEPGAVFRLGRYWLGTVTSDGSYYRFWYDERAGEVRRRTLKTRSEEAAKVALAAIVIKEGSGKPEEPQSVALIAVFARYQSEHADHTRSRTAVELAKGRLLDFLGDAAKVGDFRRAEQRRFIRHMRGLGYAVSSIAHYMTLIQAALNYGANDEGEEDGGTALLTRAPKLIYSRSAVAAELKEPEPEPKNWHPDMEQIAAFLNGLHLPDEECLRRFLIVKLAFACRSEAAMEAGPFLLDRRYKLIRLNPPGRRQTKKHRPTLPVPANLWTVLESWSDAATFVHIGGRDRRHLTTRWNRARDRVGLPIDFIPNSIRHFMATELRHAHLRYGVPRVPEDEREMWLGHRRSSVHNSYGGFEPDYLDAAKTAVEAIVDALNAQLKVPLFRQTSAKNRPAKTSPGRLNALK